MREHEAINSKRGIGVREIACRNRAVRILTRLELTSDDHALIDNFEIVDSVIKDLLSVDDNPLRAINERPHQHIGRCDVLISISSMSRLKDQHAEFVKTIEAQIQKLQQVKAQYAKTDHAAAGTLGRFQ